MRRTYTELYVHLVWSTWDRQPMITAAIERDLYAALAAKCHELGAEALAIGGTEDHVHVLVRLPAALAVADLVQQMKGSTSHLVGHALAPGTDFKWQGAYGAVSRSKDQVEAVRAYIERQREHHTAGRLWIGEE